MAGPVIAVTDSVFPSLNPAKEALARLMTQAGTPAVRQSARQQFRPHRVGRSEKLRRVARVFAWGGRSRKARLDLIGGVQAHNALVAAGLAIGSGSEADPALGALSGLRTVRGRMERAATRAKTLLTNPCFASAATGEKPKFAWDSLPLVMR